MTPEELHKKYFIRGMPDKFNRNICRWSSETFGKEVIEQSYNRIPIIYPPPIRPDPMPECLDLVVGDFKSHSITSK